MLDRKTITEIIGYGTYAPSGDNSQPWRFEACPVRNREGSQRTVSNGVEEYQINIFNIPGKDNPILNVRNRGSYIAHGALIENMLIAASHMGFEADLKIFPQGITDLTATIALTESEPKNEPLFAYIKERATNRKPYKNTPLSEGEKDVLLAAGRIINASELKLVEDKEIIKTLADAMSVTERVALETKELHRLFFKSVFWDDKKNERGESGLYIKTLELPPPAKLIFKIINRWPIIKFLNIFGFNKLVAKSNAAIYTSSAAHGAIIVENKDENFISAGRVFQRVWLEATRLGLCLQPVAGMLYWAQRAAIENPFPFSQKNADLIKGAVGKIAFSFGAGGQKAIAMLFRVGRADPPSARSRRKPPEISFKNAV